MGWSWHQTSSFELSTNPPINRRRQFSNPGRSNVRPGLKMWHFWIAKLTSSIFWGSEGFFRVSWCPMNDLKMGASWFLKNAQKVVQNTPRTSREDLSMMPERTGNTPATTPKKSDRYRKSDPEVTPKWPEKCSKKSETSDKIFGDSMVSRWWHHGDTMLTPWCNHLGHHGDTMLSPLCHHGDIRVTPWGHHGDSSEISRVQEEEVQPWFCPNC